MPYMTYSQLKNSAKTRMAPVMGKLIGAVAVQIGLSVVITEVSSIPALFAASPALQMAFYFLSTMISGTLAGMLDAGTCCLFLKLYCGRPIAVSDLFYAFNHQTRTCIGLSFLISLMAAVPLLPVQFFSLQFSRIMESTGLAAISSDIAAETAALPPEAISSLTLALFCFTPALILITILSLVYSQAYYLMLDFPSYSVKELLKKSRLLMRGHKGRLFYIQVCFLPLFLLGILTCGIGMLWIAPFISAVQTEFYLDLVTKRFSRHVSAGL